ncbi:MAG: VWA domain-containing protein [Phycisphaerales bacterium]
MRSNRKAFHVRSSTLSLAAAAGLGVLPLGGVGVGSNRAPTAASRTSQPDFHCGNVVVPYQRCYVIRDNTPRVSLEAVEAKIDIVEQVATTTLTITLGNDTQQNLEAEMVLPVPDGSAVRSFILGAAPHMQIQEPTARLLPRDEARRIYEEIVRRAKDPGLLEFAGYNMVRSSVFPVGPGGTTVTLTYEHVVSRDGARVDYLLPRSQSLENTGVKWNISATIKSKSPISTVYSPSHEITTQRVGDGELKVALMHPDNTQPGSFRLSYLADNRSISASLLAYPDPEVGGGYFLLLAGLPQERERRQHEAPKREVMIVLDRSGSMKGEKIEQARNAALAIVDGLNPGESFNIIDYSDSIAMFSEKSVVKDAKTLADARSYIAGLESNGGTNIHDALLTAVRPKPADGALPMVLFLTDGLPTVGNTSEIDIRNDTSRANAYKRRIFTFGVGYDVNAPLLDKIAETTRGSSINVLPGENVESAVSAVFRRLEGPILSEPALASIDRDGNTLPRATRELMPAALPDLFEGDQVVLLGQYKDADELRFRLKGMDAGQERSYEFHFKLDGATTRNAFVPRLWATRKIAMLVDEIRQRGAEAPSASTADPNTTDPRTRELVEEIVRLSTKFGVLTEYTSFLATQPGENHPPTRYSLGEATKEACDNLQSRAVGMRTGNAGVAQSMNVKAQAAQACSNIGNAWYDDNMNRVSITTVQQVDDQTLFRRGAKWVDARIMVKDEEAKPDRVVEFGTPEYFDIARALADEGRAGIISLRGDVYLMLKGERILVKGPVMEASEPPATPQESQQSQQK